MSCAFVRPRVSSKHGRQNGARDGCEVVSPSTEAIDRSDKMTTSMRSSSTSASSRIASFTAYRILSISTAIEDEADAAATGCYSALVDAGAGQIATCIPGATTDDTFTAYALFFCGS
jgi:hypothetical protein